MSRSRLIRAASVLAVAAGVIAVGALPTVGGPGPSPAIAETVSAKLPQPPANGELGFVVERFTPRIVQDKQACPNGPVPRIRDAFLLTIPRAERDRLKRKENEKELEARWRAYAVRGDGTNVCSQPEQFDRPRMHTVQSQYSWGLDLDGDGGRGGPSADTCAQQDFTSPTGEKGIDNQAYRVMGCTLEWRGIDGIGGESVVRGGTQFHASGEWTQVLLLRGVDSLVRDDDVEVIYGNTPDRPVTTGEGKFLRGVSFSISDAPPRHRNALRGRIVNGVLTTEPTRIQLTQTWGQGGARDIRGNRTTFSFHAGRLRLTFQSDGSLTGMVGGYQPIFELIQSPALGGAGSAVVAGIDCAQAFSAARRLADGIRDPKTGQCSGVSTAYHVTAVPAFVNDVPQRQGGTQATR